MSNAKGVILNASKVADMARLLDFLLTEADGERYAPALAMVLSDMTQGLACEIETLLSDKMGKTA